MKQVVVASFNPVKLDATRAGFETMFPEETFTVSPVAADSGVGDQPMSSRQTLEGAMNRARSAMRAKPEADFWVGIEGGVDYIDDKMQEMVTFAWVVVRSKTQIGKARTGGLQLPPAVIELVQNGVELGHADDQVFGISNSKQLHGAVGLLTGNVVTRTSAYVQAVELALIPFKNPELFPGYKEEK